MNSHNSPKPHVLIVDDEPQIGKIFGLKLRLSGYDTTSVTSGQEAVELLRTQNFDVVLLDILMPAMSGLEVLEKVRAFSKVPIIIFTARQDIFEVARNLGANDFISKPLNPDYLVEKVAGVLQRK